MKKLLATILALVMALGLCSVSWAETSGTYVAEIVGGNQYETLQEAFDAVTKGDTVKLLKNITLTSQVNITKALDGLTLDGNGKTITCATTTDPLQSGGSALYFGNADSHLYCTGIKIKDLTMTGTARFGIFLCGGTSTEFTNVNISGDYYIAVNLYGTHGAVMTNCNISNSHAEVDTYVSAVWTNVKAANPLVLNNTTIGTIVINAYGDSNKNELEPKIKINSGSAAKVYTKDDGSISGNKALCIYPESAGTYSIYERVNGSSTWTELEDAYVAQTANGNKYISLAGAAAAAGNNGTIKLLKNADFGVQTIDNLTVDLNGYALDVSTMTINGMLFVKDDTGDGSVRGTGADNTANKIKAASCYETELNDGVIVVKKMTSNSYYYYPTTSDTTTDSPKTFDAGVGIYAVTAVLSVTGMAWTTKKRH